MKRILLVDDEPNILKSLQRTLRIPGFEIDAFECPIAALSSLEVNRYRLIISDYRMPVMDGVSFLKLAKQKQPDALRIILSGYTDVTGLMNAINEAEIYRFMSKPWDDLDLQMTVRKTLEHAELIETNRKLLNHIREQEQRLESQRITLEFLEKETPGITRVNRTEDGFILMDEV